MDGENVCVFDSLSRSLSRIQTEREKQHFPDVQRHTILMSIRLEASNSFHTLSYYI